VKVEVRNSGVQYRHGQFGVKLTVTEQHQASGAADKHAANGDVGGPMLLQLCDLIAYCRNAVDAAVSHHPATAPINPVVNWQPDLV